MITIHHAPASRSCRVRWLCDELGLEYRIAPLEFRDGSMRTPEYLAKNPLGRVPTLEDDGVVIFESGAILEYLLEKYGQGRLAPEVGRPERPLYLQWFHFGEATLIPPLSDIVQHGFTRPEDERIPQMVTDGKQRFEKILDVLEAALDGEDYLVGNTFTAADIMVGYGLQLARLTGQLPRRFGHVNAYLERLSSRPAFQKAFSS